MKLIRSTAKNDAVQGQDAVPETVHHVIVMVDPRQEFITLTFITLYSSLQSLVVIFYEQLLLDVTYCHNDHTNLLVRVGQDARVI